MCTDTHLPRVHSVYLLGDACICAYMYMYVFLQGILSGTRTPQITNEGTSRHYRWLEGTGIASFKLLNLCLVNIAKFLVSITPCIVMYGVIKKFTRPARLA